MAFEATIRLLTDDPEVADSALRWIEDTMAVDGDAVGCDWEIDWSGTPGPVE